MKIFRGWHFPRTELTTGSCVSIYFQTLNCCKENKYNQVNELTIFVRHQLQSPHFTNHFAPVRIVLSEFMLQICFLLKFQIIEL